MPKASSFLTDSVKNSSGQMDQEIVILESLCILNSLNPLKMMHTLVGPTTSNLYRKVERINHKAVRLKVQKCI